MLQQTDELRRTMAKASQIADRLSGSLPELQQPAIRAQCNVIMAFLRETSEHERLFTKMIQSKLKD